MKLGESHEIVGGGEEVKRRRRSGGGEVEVEEEEKWRRRRSGVKVLDTVGCCARVPESTKTAFTAVFIISSFIYSSS